MGCQITPLHSLFQEWGAEFMPQGDVLLPVRGPGVGAEYEAARDGIALFDGGDRGWIEITGPDTADFLQRLLSSDVSKLEWGNGQWSAMLDGKGHWVSELLVYRFAAGPVDIFALDMPYAALDAVYAHLEKMHFSEDLSWTTYKPARLLLTGKRARAALVAEKFPVKAIEVKPGKAAFDHLPHGGVGIARDDRGLLFLRRPDRGVETYEIQGAPTVVSLIADRLHQNGAVPSGLAVLDMLRVEAGRPLWGMDFDSSTTLPESGEWQRVSLTKGCYTGQEVVARINTYGEAPRRICRLTFKDGVRPLRGAELQNAKGKNMGVVTSWVWSPVRDEPIGLGLIRKKSFEAGEKLTAILEGVTDGEPVVVDVPDKVVGG